MSKTVDKLYETYCLAVKAYMNSNGGALIWEAERAGIAAIVRALRDDTAINLCACKFWLDDILGDAGEKVAEYTGGMNDLSVTPATDPAPAVCEWTKRKYEPGFYATPHGIKFKDRRYDNCGICGREIKFTEAKT